MMNHTTFTQNLGRLTAGFAIASGLLVGLAVTHPHAAAADGLLAPQLISVRIDTDSTAYVRFMDPNTDESQYFIHAMAQTSDFSGSFELAGPGVPGSGRVVTRTVAGLKLGASYCFNVNARSDEDRSDDSNIICADPPAAPAASAASAPVPPPHPIDTKASDAACVACAAHLAPSLPDLAVTDIRAESSSQLSAGATAVYDIVVANTGAKLPGSGQVQVQIQVSGSVQSYAMAQTPAGFTCSGSGPVICVGPIGGYGDAPITTSVTFRMQIQGSKSGLGSLSAAADPNNLIQESDENNNAKTLPITVK
jgi:CARDB